MPGVFAVALRGSTSGTMPALVAISATIPCSVSGWRYPRPHWGCCALAAAANRVALEACVKARTPAAMIEKESRDILMEAAKHSPELGHRP